METSGLVAAFVLMLIVIVIGALKILIWKHLK